MNNTVGVPWDTKTPIIALEIANVVSASVTSWILISLTVYGLKGGLCTKKKGGSSLKSGIVFVSLTCSVAVAVPCFIITEIHFHLEADYCEILCDISTVSYFVAGTGGYTALWIHQRRIFSHPLVKTQISSLANKISWICWMIMLGSMAGMLYLFVSPDNQYAWTSNMCVNALPTPVDEFQWKSFLTLALYISTFLIPGFSVYAALRVDFNCSSSESSITRDASARSSICGNFVTTILNRTKTKFRSPIQMAVSRNFNACLVAVIFDTTSLAFSEYVIHGGAGQPMIITWTIYNCVLVIKSIAIVGLLGQILEVLLILIPRCHS